MARYACFARIAQPMYALTVLPLWASGLLLVGVTTLIAMAGPTFVRRHVSLARLSTNNEVAGFKFATVGVLYAVLVAFAIIAVWEKFDEAELAVAQEAGAAAAMHRLANGLGETFATALDAELTDYIHIVIAQDWPAMGRAEGLISSASGDALTRIYDTTMAYVPRDRREQLVQAELLRQLEAITISRRIRGVLSSGVMPPLVWWVLSGGAVLTVGFTFFFGTQNLKAQTLMTGMLSVLIFSALMVIVSIDFPFTGQVRIGPHPFERVIIDWTGHTPTE